MQIDNSRSMYDNKLMLYQVKVADMGDYVCVATNQVGSDRKTMTLIVGGGFLSVFNPVFFM